MYELIKVSESCFYIDCPAKIGVVKTGENTVCLIDSGSDKDAAKKVKRHLDANGWKLHAIYNTHSNADHIGGNLYLHEQTGCRIYAPGVECAMTRHPILEPAYLYGGFPPKELDNKFTFAPPCECLPFTPDVLPNGMKHLYVNGHSFEQLAFGTPDGVWFVADAVIAAETFPKYKISFLHSVKEHLNTLEKLKTLEGRLFIPSHRPPLDNIAELAELNRINALEVAEDIKRFCADGVTIDELLEKIFAEYKIRLYVMQYALVGFTTRSYLAWLQRRGEIAPVFEGTRLLWKTVTPE